MSHLPSSQSTMTSTDSAIFVTFLTKSENGDFVRSPPYDIHESLVKRSLAVFQILG